MPRLVGCRGRLAARDLLPRQEICSVLKRAAAKNFWGQTPQYTVRSHFFCLDPRPTSLATSSSTVAWYRYHHILSAVSAVLSAPAAPPAAATPLGAINACTTRGISDGEIRLRQFLRRRLRSAIRRRPRCRRSPQPRCTAALCASASRICARPRRLRRGACLHTAPGNAARAPTRGLGRHAQGRGILVMRCAVEHSP